MEGITPGVNIIMDEIELTPAEKASWNALGQSNHHEFFNVNRTGNSFKFMGGNLDEELGDHYIAVQQVNSRGCDIQFIIPTKVFRNHFKKAPTGGFRKRKTIRKNKKRRRRTRRARRV
jgi:hypothetical protein